MRRIVSFDTITMKPLLEELKLTSKVTYNEDKVVKVYPPVGGIVQKLTVSLGDHVEKGHVLAEIKSSDIARYTSEYQTALANQKTAKKAVDVAEELAKTGVISQKDYQTAKNNYEVATAEVTRTKRVVSIFGDSTNEVYYMRAPIPGYIVEKKISQGMTLRADEDDYAFTISDLKDVWVIANVFEHDLKYVKTGDSVDVFTLSYDKPFKGSIERISKVLDPTTKVNKIRIILPNSNYKLQPGMYATVMVKFEHKTRSMPSIHKDSYIFEENKYFVVNYRDTCDMKILNITPHSFIGDRVYLDSTAPVGTRILRNHQLMIYSKLNKKD